MSSWDVSTGHEPYSVARGLLTFLFFLLVNQRLLANWKDGRCQQHLLIVVIPKTNLWLLKI